jgi:predicted enzyme related to lactoylglutathione lyase
MSVTRFYEEIFGGIAPALRPADRVYVDDVRRVLERVWDYGGTVVDVSATAIDERVTSATFRDPSGQLVQIAAAI